MVDQLFMDQDEARKNQAMRLEFVSRLGDEFAVANLDSGDFASPGGPMALGVERKTINNLAFSIFNNELDEQLSRMVKMYDMCVLLVEGFPLPDQNGYIQIFGSGRAIPYGLLMATCAGWFGRGVWPIFVKNVQATVATVIQLHNFSNKPEHRTEFSPKKLVPAMNPMQTSDRMLLQIKGMGPAALDKLRGYEFNSMTNWTEEQWQKVLGKSLGAKAHSAFTS